MASPTPHTLPRALRLSSRKSIERLFSSPESHNFTAYPLRAVYRPTPQATGLRMLVSVPKRIFKHAVDRNRCKRQVREAFRLNRHIPQLTTASIDIAFIWIAHNLQPSTIVHQKLTDILNHIAREQCQPSSTPSVTF